MVRHGQASFGAKNYDKLSDKGIAQATALGEYWARTGIRLDMVFSGAQERQSHTLEIVRGICRGRGFEFPEPEVRNAFDEYDADSIMRHFVPRLLEHDPRLGELVGRLAEQGYASNEGRRAFQEAFGIVMKHWLRSEGQGDGVESWAHFRNRVLAGVERIRAEYGSGMTVAVFTSGGPVSAVMQYALQSPDRVALELAWVIKNGSLTEFKYAGDRFTLSGFNLTPHDPDSSLVTFR
jgi:broad specificity phosphatase PhoE